MRHWPLTIALVYMLGGIAVWISFIHTNHDGLANIGLLLYVLPVTFVGYMAGRAFGHTEFQLISDKLNYIPAHALFFFPSLFIVAGLIWWLATFIRRRATRSSKT